MQEFIIPDDGLVVKTAEGRPIFEVSIRDEGNVLRMFGADYEQKIALATFGESGLLIVGNPEGAGVAISVNEDVSEIGIMNKGKNITLAISSEHTELRFMNADKVITNKLYVDENGGQFGLANQEGDVLMSAGAEPRGGVCHLMNTEGHTVALLESREGNGNIILSDIDGDIRVMIGGEGGANILLVDKTGHVAWSTL